MRHKEMATTVNSIAKEACDKAIELSVLEAQKIIKPSADEVRASALNLINYAEELKIKNQENIMNDINILNSDNEIAALKFSTKMVKKREEFVELMKRVLTFQNLINNYLGQKVQMTFVYISPSSGEVTLYAFDNSIEDMSLDKASESHGGGITGRYKGGVIKKIAQKIVNSKYNETSLKTTFSDVYKRYRISKATLKLKGAAYILWQEMGNWDGVWISGAGPLGEAYVNFFVNEYIFSNGLEENVKDYMLNNKYGAVKADNASGLLQGDVTKGSLEFGVKIGGATALGYVDIINYAKDLLNATDINKFLRDLKDTLNKKGVNNMVKPLGGKIDDEIQQLIKPLEEYNKSRKT